MCIHADLEIMVVLLLVHSEVLHRLSTYDRIIPPVECAAPCDPRCCCAVIKLAGHGHVIWHSCDGPSHLRVDSRSHFRFVHVYTSLSLFTDRLGAFFLPTRGLPIFF